MHIAFLNPQGNFNPQDSYWTEHPDFGGQLVYVKELALAMAAQGHHVDILTRRIQDPAWPEFSAPIDTYPGQQNVRILRLPCGPDRFLPKEALWPYLATSWVPEIVAFYEREGQLPDFCTAHYADGGLAGVLMKRACGCPFTFTGHSLGAQKMDKLGANPNNLAQLDERFQFKRRLAAERLSMDRADVIVTSTRQEREEQYGHRAYADIFTDRALSPFAVIPPGVNQRIFNPQETALDAVIQSRMDAALARDLATERRGLACILASSRLDPKKNHLGLVAAYAADPELQACANLLLVVRGLPDPLHDYDRLGAAEADLMGAIIDILDQHELWGKVSGFSLESQLELAAAYRVLAQRGSVFCLTALYEPFGLAPLEAMSCGLPAVVTRNGGPSESMRTDTQEFGVLVDPTSTLDIAKGLKRLLTSRATWRTLRDAGLQRVQDRYTWDRTAAGYLARMDQVLSAQSATMRNPMTVPTYFDQPGAETDFSLDTLAGWYFPTE